jgi:hypothetical protein
MRSVFVFLTLAGAACARSSNPLAPVGDERALIVSKVGIVAVASAIAPSGRSFFDNFLPCPRRGVIDYRESPRGRSITVTGCDVGDGVVLDGNAELRFTMSNGDRSTISSVELIGPITARVSGGNPQTIATVSLSNLSFGPPASPQSLDGFNFAAARITYDGATTPLDARSTPANVFGPTLSIDAIPNPTGSLDALTEADMKYVAYHVAMSLARVLFNETLETARGDHRHDDACGSMIVTVDPVRRLPRLTMNWTRCPGGYGLFLSGNFSAEWSEFSQTSGRVTMIVTGSLTMGGGIPQTTVSRMEWTVSGISSFPANATIEGRLVNDRGDRRFSFKLVLDD